MKNCVWGPLLACAAILLLPTIASGQAESDCDGLTIKVMGIPEAAGAHCEQRKMGGGDGTATNEFIRMAGPGSFFFVSHTYAGLRTYLIRKEVKDFVGDIEAFETVSGWSDERESGDFTVRSFDAKVRGDNGGAVPCFAFSRFSAHVPNSGGYRHHIFGFYCDFRGRPVDDARIDALVASLKFEFE